MSARLVIYTTDRGLAFPTAKASLLDRGIGVYLIMRGTGFSGGRASDELVSKVDVFPTGRELVGLERPPCWSAVPGWGWSSDSTAAARDPHRAQGSS